MELGFAEIEGQKRTINLLKAGFQAGRISHAYLFFGQKGSGKYQVALTFTQLLLCENPHGTEPCGSCLQCQKVATGNHPDVKIVSPDGASLKIEQIRNLQEKVYYQAYEGQYKVIIIRQAHLFTEEAANSLLKILEEPPEKTVFLLLAEDLGKLPITIQSRCQPVPFAFSAYPDRTEETEEVLRKRERLKLEELLAGLRQGGYKEIFAWVEMIDKINKKEANKKDLIELILEQLSLIYRDTLVWFSTGRKELLMEGGETAFVSGADAAGCLQALTEINHAVYALKHNANNRLNLEALLVKLRKIEQSGRKEGRD